MKSSFWFDQINVFAYIQFTEIYVSMLTWWLNHVSPKFFVHFEISSSVRSFEKKKISVIVLLYLCFYLQIKKENVFVEA